MKVLVTGANGLVGSATVQYLQEHGHDVRATDMAEESKVSGVEYAACDIRDFDAIREQVRGCETIVHLAALPSPTINTGAVTFHINVTGTYNVFEAASEEGIKRIAQASSVNAVGMTWGMGDFVPDYLPVDEGQTRSITDPYSFSKHMIEEIGDYYWRRDQISSTALRMPAVYRASHHRSESYYANRDRISTFLDEFLALPEDERQRLLAMTRERVLAFRQARGVEFGTRLEWPSAEALGEISPVLWETYMWHRFMVWALIDVRDAAQAFMKSLTADFEGSHPLFVNDTGNFAEYDAHALASIFFPGVPVKEGEMNGKASLISIKTAQDLIGFEPVYSVLDR